MNRKFSHFKATILATASIACVSMPTGSWANEASDKLSANSSSVKDIVVTARKREERLIDVPIAITAFGADDIAEKQIRSLGDVASMSPNVVFQDVGGRSTPSLFIRGVTNTATVGRLSTAAVFVDGIYVLGGLSSVSTVDAERVEVIKGPQNAYFGRNTFAGAINFITREPSDELQVMVSTEATSRGSFDFTSSVEGALVEDVISGRLVANLNKRAAMYTATDGGAIGEENTRQISGSLSIKPADGLSIRLRADYQYNSDGPPQTAYLRGNEYGNDCSGRVIKGGDQQGNPQNFGVTLPYFCGSIPTMGQVGEGVVTSNTSFNSPFWSQFGNPNALYEAFVENSLGATYVGKAPKIDHFGMVRKMLRLSGSVDYELTPSISTVLNLGYNKNDTIVIQDTDRADIENIYAIMPALYEDVSAELRFQSTGNSRFKWMVGANYFNSTVDRNASGDVTFQVRFMPNSTQTTGGVLFNPQNTDGERAKVWALFGSMEYELMQGLTVSGELRYQSDKSISSPDLPTSQYATFKDWLPRVILKYAPNRDSSIYATWSRGVLPGQFNTQYIAATQAERDYIDTVLPGSTEIFQSQRLDNYEIGFKQSLFNRRFQYSLSAYLMKWGNLPSSSAVTVPGSPTRFTALITAGDATLKGLEFEGSVRPLDGLDLGFGISYQEGKYDSFTQGLLATGLVQGMYDFADKNLARMPSYLGNASISYTNALNDDWNWFAGSEVKYTGSAWESEANIVKSDDYFRVNARIGVENDTYRFELFATNLFNDKTWDYAQRYVSFAEPGSQVHPFQGNPDNLQFRQGLLVGAPDKREIGVRVRMKF